MRISILKSLIAVLLLSGASHAFSQEVTTFIIKGQVTHVDDPDGLLDGTIAVGEAVKGRIKFHHGAADQNPDVTVGDYSYQSVPGGMWVQINRYLFKTNPGPRDFLVVLVNRSTAQFGDAMAFRSNKNVFPLSLDENEIIWQLNDSTGAALNDVNLPKHINLPAWRQPFGLTLEGVQHPPRLPDRKLLIRAIITKVLLPKTEATTLKDETATETEALPEKYTLMQNFPNPFNPSTVIGYALPEESFVSLRIYDLLGKEVRTLVDDFESAGMKSARWDGKDDLGREVAAGLYIYRLEAEDFTQAKKLAFVK